MIVSESFIRKLKGFGLNSYEAKIWAALLSRGVSSAGELSDIANVPRSRSYDVLESLEKKGFIMLKPGKPLKYVALAPGEVVERIKKRVLQDALVQEQGLDSLRQSEVLLELTQLHGQGSELLEPADLSGSLKGRTNIYNHLESMINGAKTSVAIVTTEHEISSAYEVLLPVLKRAAKRGVEIKISAPLGEKSLHALTALSAFCKVRPMMDVTARICIVDGEEIMFMLLDDKDVHQSYDTGVWVNTGFFASALMQMFSVAWEKAAPLERAAMLKN